MDEKDPKPLRVSNWTAEDDGITTKSVRAEVLPARRRVVSAKLRPHIADMLDTAYDLLAEELRRLKLLQWAEDGEGKPISVGKLEALVRSLERLQKAEIEQEKRDNPTNKPDDELLRALLSDPGTREGIKLILAEYEDGGDE